MKIKKYRADTLPKAIQLAKIELGEDIVLLESKQFRDRSDWTGGKKSVEIAVAVNEEKQQQSQRIKSWNPPKINTRNIASQAYKKTQGTLGTEPQKPIQSSFGPESFQAGQQGFTPPIYPSPQSDLNKTTGRKTKENFDQVLTNILSKRPQEYHDEKLILKEIAELKKEIKQLNRKNTDTGNFTFPDDYEKVFNLLEERGVEKNIASMLVQRSYFLTGGTEESDYKTVVNSVKTEMGKIFKSYNFSANNKNKRQQIILLLGSTGVGKSTTTMKLATHKDLYGQKKVGIISTDPYGPTTALRSFENITGIPVVEARAFEEIKHAMETLQDREVIIVDTPGSSPFAPNHLEKLERYVDTVEPTDIFLVLSMSTDTRDLFLSCGTYLLLKPTGIIFTKFDETTQPGKVYSIIDELELPAVCFCEGERIFIDVAAGRQEFLSKKIFELY